MVAGARQAARALSPSGLTLQALSFGACPWALSSCSSNHLILFFYIKMTGFPWSVPHLALNCQEPTGEMGLGGLYRGQTGGGTREGARVGGGNGIVGSTLTFEVSSSGL